MEVDEVTKIDSFNISESVLNKIAIAARKAFLEQKTTGGILLGQVAKNIAYVMQISEQKQKGDAAHPFERTKEHGNKAIDRWFKQSEGRTVYQGEWFSTLDAKNSSTYLTNMQNNLLESITINDPNIDTLVGIVIYPRSADELVMEIVVAGGKDRTVSQKTRKFLYTFTSNSAKIIA